MAYYLEIHASDRSPERIELTGRIAFVTRDGFKITLPAKDCPSELHLLEIWVDEGGAQVAIPANAPGSFGVNGTLERNALVSWGAEIFWEGLRLSCVEVSKPKERAPVVLLALVVAMLCGGFAFARGTAPDSSVKEPEAPAIEPTPAACPPGDAETSARRARLAERTALAKREQSVFRTADGVAALTSFGDAAACYAAAGQSEDAARAAAELRDWSARLNADYGAVRVRLQRALAQGRDAEALSAATELERLLVGRAGPYRDWLSAQRVRLESRIRRTGS